MTEENVPNVTPPDVGQPQETTGNDEWNSPEETDTEETTSTEESPENAMEEAALKAETREKFYQTRYQELKADLKASGLSDYANQPELPSPVSPMEDVPPNIDDDDYTGIRAEIRAMEARLLNAQAQSAYDTQQRTNQSQYVKEYKSVHQAVNRLVVESGATQQDVSTAYQFACDMAGSLEQMQARVMPGAPTRFYDAFGMALGQAMRAGSVTNSEQSNTAMTEQKIMDAKMVMQPDGAAGGMKEQQKLTKEAKYLKAMQDIGSSEAHKEVFE